MATVSDKMVSVVQDLISNYKRNSYDFVKGLEDLDKHLMALKRDEMKEIHWVRLLDDVRASVGEVDQLKYILLAILSDEKCKSVIKPALLEKATEAMKGGERIKTIQESVTFIKEKETKRDEIVDKIANNMIKTKYESFRDDYED